MSKTPEKEKDFEFGLLEGIRTFQELSSKITAYWNLLSGFAVAAFVILPQFKSPRDAGIILAIGFCLFAISNATGICLYQRQMIHFRAAIERYLQTHQDAVPEEFKPAIISSSLTVPIWLVLLLHIVIDIMILSVILVYSGYLSSS